MTAAGSGERPLAGRRVLVTRPREVASDLVSRLEALGAEAIVAPLIRIEPPEDPAPLRSAASEAATFDAIVFTSRHAVDAFVHARRDSGAGDALDRPLLCAVGPGTAARLAAHGYRADIVPGEFRAEGLLEALLARGVAAGARVLVPRADIGRDVVAEGLRQAGARVTDVVAYRTVADAGVRTGEGPDAAQLLRDGRIDVVTFTSGSAVTSFVRAFGTDEARRLLAGVIVATIGPVTSAAVRELGLTVHVQAASATAADLVHAIAGHLSASAARPSVLFK